jgi:hypothetical protein
VVLSACSDRVRRPFSLVICDTAHRSGRLLREQMLDHEPDGRRHVKGIGLERRVESPMISAPLHTLWCLQNSLPNSLT